MSDADILAKLARWAKQNPDAVAGDHAGEELLELVRSIRTPPAPPIPAQPQAAPTREQIADIIRDKVDYFLHDEQGPLDAADAILALSRPERE